MYNTRNDSMWIYIEYTHYDRSWLWNSGDCLTGFSYEILEPLAITRPQIQMCWFSHASLFCCVADQRAPGRHASLRSNFFHLYAVSGRKICQIMGWHSHLWSWCPHSGKSWIRHWIGSCLTYDHALSASHSNFKS